MTVVSAMAPERRRAAALVIVGGALFLGFGLWVSLHYAFGVWKPDADICVMVELWRGFQQHGWSFFASWAYTQDNWLLSIIPISSALLGLLGPRAEVAMLVGWLSFASSVGLTAWLAHRLAGLKAAFPLACVLLFGGCAALGGAGYLAYPISHNVSMTWGLLALVLSVLALERAAFWLALLAAAAVFIDAISDPWAGVAIAVPLIVASGVIAALNRRTRLGGCAAVLSLATALALLAARTRLFGALAFLPESHFKFADPAMMLANVVWAYRTLGAMFSVVPGVDPTHELACLISVAALAGVLGAAIILSAAGLRRASPPRQLVGGAALLSMGAVGGLFVAGVWDQNIAVGRFFPNVYFLGGLLIAVLSAEHWTIWPRAERIGLVVYAGLFVAAGMASGPDLWSGGAWTPSPRQREAAQLGDFLTAHGLSYGYGPFWGSQALLMDSVTDGRVTIRPVSYGAGRIRRRPAETSSFWYRRGAEPAHNRPFLVIRPDGEECNDLGACIDAARRQFGEPVERLAWADAVVLVWPGEIAGAIDP